MIKNLASKHPMQQLTKNYTTDRNNNHQRLFIAENIYEQFSFLLNMLPLSPSAPSKLALTWSQQLPIMYSVLHKLYQLQHGRTIPIKHPHDEKLLIWLN
ncbi:hypothetical protein BCV72DRAFT_282917 [Rhizopus microsporus var. microsporus]|uniref:Uncharacterized protein n=2 Tax=Rhizopus microsporus TaxID=58291 RepID=A0A2G4SMG6_RHIZD|nr:uncharacterized protein RHIMIDRAFT_261312 [Rhizopus microsporus ATCC 52813]ORE01004.1 hypothetical protein BCV72DRAFT_282917 [Rhizopus microsporus var. microsporus]PHZ09932.1 hypothetical protein RHIMIDRAFT_261312 [Rhizopus microsporus ATCC 52813]